VPEGPRGIPTTKPKALTRGHERHTPTAPRRSCAPFGLAYCRGLIRSFVTWLVAQVCSDTRTTPYLFDPGNLYVSLCRVSANTEALTPACNLCCSATSLACDSYPETTFADLRSAAFLCQTLRHLAVYSRMYPPAPISPTASASNKRTPLLTQYSHCAYSCVPRLARAGRLQA
jgi:hypothetical protein